MLTESMPVYEKNNFGSLLNPASRIESLDMLRGIIMVIITLDYVRFFYKANITEAAETATDPTDLTTTILSLFFIRWITHFYAPVTVRT